MTTRDADGERPQRSQHRRHPLRVQRRRVPLHRVEHRRRERGVDVGERAVRVQRRDAVHDVGTLPRAEEGRLLANHPRQDVVPRVDASAAAAVAARGQLIQPVDRRREVDGVERRALRVHDAQDRVRAVAIRGVDDLAVDRARHRAQRFRPRARRFARRRRRWSVVRALPRRERRRRGEDSATIVTTSLLRASASARVRPTLEPRSEPAALPSRGGRRDGAASRAAREERSAHRPLAGCVGFASSVPTGLATALHVHCTF